MLDRLLDCLQDDPVDCPVTGTYIRARVDAVLACLPFTDDFLRRRPPSPGATF